MAFSKSIQKAQLPISCNLCETDAKIKWKCLQCDLLMCNQCKEKIHTKFKFAKDHKIVDTKDVGLHSQELDFSDIKCQEHKGQMCFMHCSSCNQLVCPSCIAKVHNGHKLVEIREGYQAHVEKLKDAQKQAFLNINELTKAETQIKSLRNAEISKYTQAKNSVQAHEIELTKIVKKHIRELTEELDQKWNAIQKAMDQEENKVTKMRKQIEDQNTMAENILNTRNAEQMFENGAILEKSLREPVAPLELKFNSVPTFVPGQITQYNVGSLNDITSNITMKINHQYTSDIPRVGYLSTPPDGCLWISDANVVQKVKPEMNKLKVVNSYNIEIFGIAVTPSNDLLLACGSSIKQISGSTGKLTNSIFTVDPPRPTAVHVTKDNKILIGAKNVGTDFPVSGRRVIIMMNKDGVNQTTYEHDKNNQPLFTYVKCITSTNAGTIFMVNRLSKDGRGRVGVLGQDGGVLNMYNGHPDINTEDKPFQPVQLVTTPSDNVIVSQLNYNFLHILNSVGHLITYYNTTNIGIKAPFSLSFTKIGQLYIGCTTPKSSADKAKLYEVDIFGV